MVAATSMFFYGKLKILSSVPTNKKQYKGISRDIKSVKRIPRYYNHRHFPPGKKIPCHLEI